MISASALPLGRWVRMSMPSLLRTVDRNSPISSPETQRDPSRHNHSLSASNSVLWRGNDHGLTSSQFILEIAGESQIWLGAWAFGGRQNNTVSTWLHIRSRHRKPSWLIFKWRRAKNPKRKGTDFWMQSNAVQTWVDQFLMYITSGLHMVRKALSSADVLGFQRLIWEEM